MKILLFTENYYKGGLDTFIISLINNWPDKYDTIELMCNYDHPGNETYNSQINRKVKLRYYKNHNSVTLENKFKTFSVIKYFSKVISVIIRYPLFIINIFSFRDLLLQGKPDRLMVINGGYPGGDFCRAASISWGIFSPNKSSIHNFHNIAHKPRILFFIFEYLIDKIINKYSNYLISVSKFSSESILKRLGFSGTEKIRYVYNGISPQKNIKKTSLQIELNVNKNDKICTMLGTFEPRKGHKFVLNAFRKVVDRIPDTHLICAGYGYKKEIEHINELVNEYGLNDNVHILEFREDKENLLSQTDILIIGSQAYESFGYTAIEAMASKVPVVATNIGGLPEVVKDGEGGYCLKHDDVDNYANKIIELLQDKRLRIDQGVKGYYRYKNKFSAKVMAKKYYKFIKE